MRVERRDDKSERVSSVRSGALVCYAQETSLAGLLHSRFLSLQQCYSLPCCISRVCLFVPVFGSSALDKDDTTRNYII